MKTVIIVMSVLMIVFGIQARAQDPKQLKTSVETTVDKTTAITGVVEVIEDGTFMNIQKVSVAIDEPELYNSLIFDNDMTNIYRPSDKSSPFEFIRHEVMFSSLRHNFSEISGVAEFAFKPNDCPSVDEVERATGVKAHEVKQPTSPDLITGKGGSYTVHYFYLSNHKILSLTGCRISAFASARLS